MGFLLGSGAGVLNRCPSPVSGRTVPCMPPGHLCNLRPSWAVPPGQPLCPCGMTTAHLVAASACRANDGLSTSVPVAPCGPCGRVVCSMAGRAETSFLGGRRGLASRGERLTLRTRSASRRGGQKNAHADMAVCAGALCTGDDTRFCRPARRHPGIRHFTSTPQPSPGGGSRQALLPPTPAARSCPAPARTRLHGTCCKWTDSPKL